MVPDLKYIYINTYICTCKYPACVDIKTTDGLVGLQHPAKYKIVFVKGIVHGNQVHQPPPLRPPRFFSFYFSRAFQRTNFKICRSNKSVTEYFWFFWNTYVAICPSSSHLILRGPPPHLLWGRVKDTFTNVTHEET